MTRFFLILVVLIVSLSASAGFYEDSIKYLASKKLEGRKPGTQGNVLAQDYSINKFKQFNLQPLAGSFKQDFTIFTKMIKKGNNSLSTNTDIDKSFQPISSSLSGEVLNSKMVFVGYGITIPKSDPQLKYDDYANMDVKGKIVIILTGDPAIGNMNSPFRHPDYINYRSIHYKLKNAAMHEARGVLIVENPLSLTNYPIEPKPIFNATEGGGNRFSIIAGYSTNKWLNKHLPRTSLLKFQNRIKATGKPNSKYLPGLFNLSVSLKKQTGRVSNIVAVLPGQDPVLKKEVIVVGAHFDHLGHGGESSMDPHGHGKIHPGADDNASGTAMVLKLAKELSTKKHKRTYVFALFNAEESGLLGSAHFVAMWSRHETQYGKIMSMLNYDMVGRYVDHISIMGANSSTEWKSVLNPISSSLNFVIKNSSVGSSDHASFTAKEIPSLFFTTGAHEDYHRSTDTAEKINYQSLSIIEKYSLRMFSNLEREKALIFNTTYNDGQDPGRTRGYGAHLGCVPKFGQSDNVVGVLCVRASDGSPAMDAGIIANDILIQIGEIDIKSIYDLAFALKYYRAGDKVELAWKRNNMILKKVITLTKSSRH